MSADHHTLNAPPVRWQNPRVWLHAPDFKRLLGKIALLTRPSAHALRFLQVGYIDTKGRLKPTPPNFAMEAFETVLRRCPNLTNIYIEVYGGGPRISTIDCPGIFSLSKLRSNTGISCQFIIRSANATAPPIRMQQWLSSRIGVKLTAQDRKKAPENRWYRRARRGRDYGTQHLYLKTPQDQIVFYGNRAKGAKRSYWDRLESRFKALHMQPQHRVVFGVHTAI